MRSRFLAAGVFALLAPSPAARAESLVVAVFDIEAPTLKLQATAVDGLSEYVATQLAAASTLRVVPRTDLHERLASQKVASFKACYQETCQIEIGKELAAQAVLSTKIIRIDKRCVAAMKLFDLRTATAIAASTQEGDCAESALLALLNQTITTLVTNAKSWQLRAAWDELEAALPNLTPSEKKLRLDALLERFPGHAPAVEARAKAVRELEAATKAEADKNRALGKVQVAGGAWCFPGQAFGNGRCVGVPTKCPTDFAIDAKNEMCAPPPCTAGRTRVDDGIHCCWKNQIWSPDRRVCVGNPTCPAGQVALKERCGEPTAPLIQALRSLLTRDYVVRSERDACSPLTYRHTVKSVQPCRIDARVEVINGAGDEYQNVNCQDYLEDGGAYYALVLDHVRRVDVWDLRGQKSESRAEESFMRISSEQGYMLTYVGTYSDVSALAENAKRLAFVCGAENIETEVSRD